MSTLELWFRRFYEKHNYETTNWHLVKGDPDRAIRSNPLETGCGRLMERDTGNAGKQRLEWLWGDITQSKDATIGKICTICRKHSPINNDSNNTPHSTISAYEEWIMDIP